MRGLPKTKGPRSSAITKRKKGRKRFFNRTVRYPLSRCFGGHRRGCGLAHCARLRVPNDTTSIICAPVHDEANRSGWPDLGCRGPSLLTFACREANPFHVNPQGGMRLLTKCQVAQPENEIYDKKGPINRGSRPIFLSATPRTVAYFTVGSVCYDIRRCPGNSRGGGSVFFLT